MSHDEQRQPLTELMARVLAKVEADTLREVLGAAIRSALKEYECQKIVQEVVAPLVKQIVAEELERPEMQEQLKLAVKGSLARMLPQMKVEFSRF